jgi:hypothetical protein
VRDSRAARRKPLVLLVGDDLKVGPIDSTLALARTKAGELVALDQVPIERVVEELTDRLLNLGALRPRSRHGLVTSEAVERPILNSRTNGRSPSRIRRTVESRRPVALLHASPSGQTIVIRPFS